ncbi:MAG: DUF4402 domain-containing protein [Fusobacteriaceae bacterium]
MKKYIFLMFIIVFNIAFSFVDTNEAEFKVRLKLIEPITIQVDEHMNFGLLKKGTENVGMAAFTVKGEVGKKYNVVISEKSELVHKTNLNEKIPVDLTLEGSTVGEILSEETQFKIKGTANYAQERQLQSGEYSGTIVVRVNYN